MNLEIPLIVYRYIIVFTIFIVLGIGGLLYFKYELDKINKAILIWYVIILEINLIHLFYIFYFYDKNKVKVGKKGPNGDMGPRGFKGKSQICSSCGLAGKKETIYAGSINDFGEKITDNSKITSDGEKCVFPFVHNYSYKYKPVKDDSPPGQTKNDAHVFGWCATKVDKDFIPVEYGYVNQNETIRKRLDAESQYRNNRKNYIENNTGILEIDIVYGNNEAEALQKCDEKPGFKVYPQDLNSGVDGKFIYLCYKEGIGNKGISELLIKEGSPTQTITTNDGDNYKLINVNLNEAVDTANEIYLYKLYSDTNFIKKIIILDNKTLPTSNSDFKELTNPEGQPIHLNYDSSHTVKLYYSKTSTNLLSIDSAFVYKDGYLYAFRGNKFYKFDKIPKQQTITIQPNFPQNISVMWGKSPNKNNNNEAKDCSDIIDENYCGAATNCSWDKISDDNGVCEDISNYDAVFTYGYTNKTYLFKGNYIYKYDDDKRKISSGYPKKIDEVFKGIPSNINAVFTWGKDKKTYFFKGPLYYKYDDKNNKVEYGYPRKTATRWNNIPIIFDAIFTLKNTLDNNSDNHPTYIISGDMSYYIDPVSDNIINKKHIDKRFSGLQVSEMTPDSIPTNTVPQNVTTATGDGVVADAVGAVADVADADGQG